MALTKVNSVGIATGISLTGITTTQDTKVGSGITLSPDGNVYATGVVTATSYFKQSLYMLNVFLFLVYQHLILQT